MDPSYKKLLSPFVACVPSNSETVQ
jgi:hypothetical protein